MKKPTAMDDLDRLYREGSGQNMFRGYTPSQSGGGMERGQKMGKALGSLGSQLLGPEGDSASSMAGSRGAYRASQMRPAGPTQGTMDQSAMAAGAGSYQAGRAVQGPQGYDGGQMVRPIDKTNPYAPPKPLSPDDRKLSGELDAASEDYMGKLKGTSRLTPSQRKLSRDLDTETDDFLAKMGALYGSGRGGA